MKLSVFYSHIKDASTQSGKSEYEILQNAKCAGISAVDVSVEEIDSIPFDDFRKNPGIEIASIYSFYDWNGKEYGDDTRLISHIEKAAFVGCRSVLVVPGFLNEDTSKRMNNAQDVDSFMNNCEDVLKMLCMLRRAVAYGKEKGITVTLEDFDSDKSPCSRIPCLLWFLKNVDGLKITFDTGNFLYPGENITEGYEALKEHIIHVHCKDRNADLLSCSVTGDGIIPLSSVIKDLNQNGYDGYFSIEHFGLSDMEQGILKSAKNMKRCSDFCLKYPIK